MSVGHARDAVRPSQPETTLTNCSDGAYVVYVASLVGGGILPESGEFTIPIWAKIMGRSIDTVAKWFEEADLPYRRYGEDRYYDAVDVRASAPKVQKCNDINRPRRGGKRVRKGT